MTTTLPSREADACRQLWIAVIACAARDLTSRTMGGGRHDTARQNLETHQALQWLGSPAFRIVCDLAGVCPRRTEAALRRLAGSQLSKDRRGRVMLSRKVLE